MAFIAAIALNACLAPDKRNCTCISFVGMNHID
jgi:hypothetical protein